MKNKQGTRIGRTRTHYATSILILRVWKMMKEEPNRTFIRKDIVTGHTLEVKNAFECLETLGIVKKVKAVFRTGKFYRTERNTMAWRLIKKKEEDNTQTNVRGKSKK